MTRGFAPAVFLLLVHPGIRLSEERLDRLPVRPARLDSDAEPKRIGAVRLAVDERERVGEDGGDGVVVDDDHIDAELSRAGDLVDGAGAAVERDEQGRSVAMEGFDRDGVQAVALAEAIGDVRHRGRAEGSQRLRHLGDGGDAVDVEVGLVAHVGERGLGGSVRNRRTVVARVDRAVAIAVRARVAGVLDRADVAGRSDRARSARKGRSRACTSRGLSPPGARKSRPRASQAVIRLPISARRSSSVRPSHAAQSISVSRSSVGTGTPQSLTVTPGVSAEVPITLDHGGQNIAEIVAPPLPDEISLENNRAIAVVEGIRDRLRVLLVSGEPHPGERTWRNLLKADASVDLVHFTILRPPEKQDGTPINELALIAFPTRELFIDKIKEFDVGHYNVFHQQVTQHRVMRVTSMNDLPLGSAEREFALVHGFRPALLFPLTARAHLMGVIGFYGRLDEQRDADGIARFISADVQPQLVAQCF